jgi:hypothetical protein
MDMSIDRLAVVSQVMFDQRILDLRNENDDLRNKVAIYQYGADALNHMLAEVNDTGLTEVCKCTGCYSAKRFSNLEPKELMQRLAKKKGCDDDESEVCILKKCLLWQCDRLGLTYVFDGYTGESDGISSEGSTSEEDEDNEKSETDADIIDIDGSTQSMSEKWRNADCHLVLVDEGGFWTIHYGSKLAWNGFHSNPSIEALKELFELMRNGEDFFKVDGNDYFSMADTDAYAEDSFV